MTVLLLAALAAAAQTPAQPPAQGRVVEEIVAVVRNPATASPRVVTLTKLSEEARVALVSRGATAAATAPLDGEALRAALDWLVAQMLVADEAARLRVAEVPREEAILELRAFRARFATPKDYARFLSTVELTEDELVVTLSRMVRVRRYLESRVGRGVRVDDREVDLWLEGRGASGASGAAREAARAELVAERADAQVRELVAELRARADVRILGRLREPGGEG